MKITQEIIDNIKEVVIHLKGGKRKYGMLIDNSGSEGYYFISNSDVNMFRKTQSNKYIEVVAERLIEAIDVDLK